MITATVAIFVTTTSRMCVCARRVRHTKSSLPAKASSECVTPEQLDVNTVELQPFHHRANRKVDREVHNHCNKQRDRKGWQRFPVQDQDPQRRRQPEDDGKVARKHGPPIVFLRCQRL